MGAPAVIVGGGFDDIRSRDLRFLEEASRIGEVTALLWSDAAVAARTGAPPVFPFAERAYVLEAVRFVRRVVGTDAWEALPAGLDADIWAARDDDPDIARLARRSGLGYRVLTGLEGFPEPVLPPRAADSRKVAVTGCFDWLHSGHVRFFEEASALGDLYVFLGNDQCIAGLKGKGHPLYPEDERRYVVGSIKHVTKAQVSAGSGWLDADAEIRALRPDFFVVNEDGDRDDKRAFCRELGIEYRVLKRIPAPGLPARRSTKLRGF
jgi:cytidyltransferase-like protein